MLYYEDFFYLLLIGDHSRELQFPIGIDSDRFVRALENTQVQNHMRDLKQRFAGRKVERACLRQDTYLMAVI